MAPSELGGWHRGKSDHRTVPREHQGRLPISYRCISTRAAIARQADRPCQSPRALGLSESRESAYQYDNGRPTRTARWYWAPTCLSDLPRRSGSQNALKQAVELLALSHRSDARATGDKADLLYRSNQPARAVTLFSAGEFAPQSESDLRCTAFSMLAERDFDGTLEICRSWMKRYPASAQWASMGLITYSERAHLHSAKFLPAAETLLPHMRRSDSLGRIAQFWNDPEPPPDVRAVMDTWAAQNPTFRYERFNDLTGRQFLERYFDERAIRAYDNCAHPAMRGDYFRLAYLSVVGGVFIDADERCVTPLLPALEACSGT